MSRRLWLLLALGWTTVLSIDVNRAAAAQAAGGADHSQVPGRLRLADTAGADAHCGGDGAGGAGAAGGSRPRPNCARAPRGVADSGDCADRSSDQRPVDRGRGRQPDHAQPDRFVAAGRRAGRRQPGGAASGPPPRWAARNPVRLSGGPRDRREPVWDRSRRGHCGGSRSQPPAAGPARRSAASWPASSGPTRPRSTDRSRCRRCGGSPPRGPREAG